MKSGWYIISGEMGSTTDGDLVKTAEMAAGDGLGGLVEIEDGEEAHSCKAGSSR